MLSRSGPREVAALGTARPPGHCAQPASHFCLVGGGSPFLHVPENQQVSTLALFTQSAVRTASGAGGPPAFEQTQHRLQAGGPSIPGRDCPAVHAGLTV
ncbi:hypothetical protein PAL_GLEAN10022767 [Pteropus alecto]|uniref:Uncharacterized protein n=1 Tax=Pteropus alecto TaxID=9402 RepID=L5K6V9_PTEAL|nr:hypothetical protein PAL_GLEAN10022767 [Pteropus alecto]